MNKKKVIAWWSGGITSAVACYMAIKTFKDVEIVFQDTMNEDDDTYRFLQDCENLYGQKIIRITAIGEKWDSIESIWDHHLSLSVAHGAICSTELKREVREAYQDLDIHWGQVFGFEYEKKQIKRHKQMRMNYPEINVISLLIDNKWDKEECKAFFKHMKIDIPIAYTKYELENNNCLKTGCVRGGVGYWKKYRTLFPERFIQMAKREHRFSDIKGHPVTICKDQSIEPNELVFLMKHPNFPKVKTIDDIKGRQPKPIMECFGFCATQVNPEPVP